MSKLDDHDKWLTTDEFAALTAHQPLESVDGPDGIIFPPTFAAAEGGEDDDNKKGDYNIDHFTGEFTAKIGYRHPADQEVRAEIEHASAGNVCLINSVGAEANRVEPIFHPLKGDPKLSKLIPQVVIKAGKQSINLLEAGHRAGDAIVRFTKLGERIFDAFRALIETGNAEPLARVAPTSIVFGVWDSRGTQAKVPRVFRSVVRAFNVRRLTRSAQFNRATKYVENGLIDERLDKGSGSKNPLSREGFKDNPASGSPGGVQVTGDLRRDMTINLSAIRRLRVPDAADPEVMDTDRTLALRRYILGLALVAATARNDERFDLREGCQLRVKRGGETAWHAVRFEGNDQSLTDLTADAAREFAELAASAFVVEKIDPVDFDQRTAEKWLELDKKTQDKLRRDNPMTKQFPESAGEAPTESVTAAPRGGRRRGGAANPPTEGAP